MVLLSTFSLRLGPIHLAFSLRFFPIDDDELNIPNVFTPNGDDKNQLFKFSVKDLKEIRVEIYNRWGVNVYSWNSLQDGWDGKTRNGMESPEGTYYYLVNATNWRGRTITQKGWFSLLR